jgi:hypothetical protein
MSVPRGCQDSAPVVSVTGAYFLRGL